jgi:hypothetical protein
MYQQHLPRWSPTDQGSTAAESLPTMYDLPSESPEDLGLPDEFHDFQPKLLRATSDSASSSSYITNIEH